MKKFSKVLFIVLLITSCGNPSPDRENFRAGSSPRGGLGRDSSKMVTSCEVTSKFEKFTVALDERNPATKKVLRNSYSESKELVEEYNFQESGYSMKAYLVSKEDGSTYDANPKVISFAQNDKKLIRYRYNDEEAFDVVINCSTNQPIEVSVDLN